MKGSELLGLLKGLARKRGWDYEWIPDREKGSHSTLRMNQHLTIVCS